MPVIEVEHPHKQYRDQVAVDDRCSRPPSAVSFWSWD
jgi:hypothetical protein